MNERAQQEVEEERQQNLQSILRTMIVSKYFTPQQIEDTAIEFGMLNFYRSLTGDKNGFAHTGSINKIV